jgi:protein-disulfide isomerase
VHADGFDLVGCVDTVQTRLSERAARQAVQQCSAFVAPGPRLGEFSSRLYQADGRASERMKNAPEAERQRLERFTKWVATATSAEIEDAWRGTQSAEIQLACLDRARFADPRVARAAMQQRALEACSHYDEGAAPQASKIAAPTGLRVAVLDTDPTQGPSDALVTIVEFAGFQCPFSKRVQETLRKIEATYGPDVRIVWKDNPLPFHPRSKPSALLARLFLKLQGASGFWQVHDALFESQPKLEDDDLRAISERLGLPWDLAKQTIDSGAFVDQIDAGVKLAETLQARGSPVFFVNGVRLAGAQPFEKFQELIDKQLSIARSLVNSGVPRERVYDLVARQEPPPVEVSQEKGLPAEAPGPAKPLSGGAQE